MFKKKQSISTRIALSSLVFISFPLLSETQRDLSSHEHGASVLNIVQDDNNYFIEFESPWMNLVGFEHEPSTVEQEESIKKALERLESDESIFSFDEDSGCQRTSVEVSSTIANAEEHEEHDREESKNRDYDTQYGENENHAEVIASYSYTCMSINKAKALRVGLFDLWPGVEEIDVQIAGPGGQSRAELSSSSNTLKLQQVR